MAYECQNFRNGQILTAECLNKIDEWLSYICGREVTAAHVENGELIFTFCNGETLNVGNVAEATPTKLPNPHALTINGTSYDGSKAVSVNIEGGSGGETVYVTFTYDIEGDAHTADKTPSEIMSAYRSGQTIIATFKTSDGAQVGASVMFPRGDTWLIAEVRNTSYLYRATVMCIDPSVPDSGTIMITRSHTTSDGGVVKSVNGVKPDENGNVTVNIEDGTDAEWVATSEQIGGSSVFNASIPFTYSSYSLGLNEKSFNVNAGIEYDVYWNGTKYVCTAFATSSEIFLGNADLTAYASLKENPSSNKNAPFVFSGMNDMITTVTKNSTAAENIDISITTHAVTVYNKLPEVYLPDCVVKSVNGEKPDANGNVNASTPTDEQVSVAVSEWLDDHPEATTTVADGSITEEKLSEDVRSKLESGGSTANNLVLKSPDGTEWNISVSNNGVITATKLTNGDDTEDAPTTLETYTIFAPENVSDEWKVTGDNGTLNMSTAEFLELFYDGFVSSSPNGVAVTKKSIGKDESGLYDMWEYDFCPANYNRTILLSSGMHTYELAASFGLANFIGHLYTDTDNEAFDYIRNNVRIKVIPVVNPWGFNQYPKKYGNINGVNPNRNFDLNGAWAAFPDYIPSENEWNVKGDSPFSEAEAHNLARWVEANWNAEFWIDCHTGEGYGDKDLWVYYASDSPILNRINGGISAIEAWFRETYGTNCVTTRTIDSDGSIRLFWAEKVCGIPGMTLEQAPKRTTYGTAATNEAADISNYSTNISTFVQEFLMEKYRSTETVAIQSVALSDVTIPDGTPSVTVTATVSPADTTQGKFEWISSNESIVRVYGGTEKAVIVKVGVGKATITCKNRYNSAIVAQCAVVVEGSEEVEGVTAVNAELAGINFVIGYSTANTARLTSDYIEVTPGSYVRFESDQYYYLKVWEYDEDGVFLANSYIGDFTTSDISGTLSADAKYIRITCKKQDNSAFTEDEANSATITTGENEQFAFTLVDAIEDKREFIDLPVEVGTIKADMPYDESNAETTNGRYRTVGCIDVTNGDVISNATNTIRIVVRVYDSTGAYLGTNDDFTLNDCSISYSNAATARILFESKPSTSYIANKTARQIYKIIVNE